MTPLTGWLSVRIGRKQTFLISIAGFTVASMLSTGRSTNYWPSGSANWLVPSRNARR